VGAGIGGVEGQKHTTHFSVVDEQGGAVAMTTTVNTGYGSGVTVTGAGFVLNNEMDDFATKPGQPNVFGLVQGESNAIAPGKRMLSSMTPTVVVGPGGKVRMVIGAAGGPTIITATFHVLSNVIDYGMNVRAAVGAPRFHHQHLPDKIFYEENGLPKEVLDALRVLGHEVMPRSAIADSPAILRDGRMWTGSPEPRNTGGLALGK
jgi:gamma-glutamyltranspeptidase/glutathione hydrolase